MSVRALPLNASGFRVVVLVASMGGLKAVTELLSALPHNFPVPLLLVQHRQLGGDIDRLANVLQTHSPFPVVTATDGMALESRTMTVIPGGMTAKLDGARHIHLVSGVNGHGGDETLSSAAECFGSAAIAVILSGMLNDGTSGVRAIKRRGGRVLAQDPTTARASGMPAGAIATGCVDYVLTPRRIASALTALTMAPGGAELLAVSTPHWASYDP